MSACQAEAIDLHLILKSVGNTGKDEHIPYVTRSNAKAILQLLTSVEVSQLCMVSNWFCQYQ